MKRSEIRGQPLRAPKFIGPFANPIPDFVSLHPGYKLSANRLFAVVDPLAAFGLQAATVGWQ
jgi:hypothetical protein